MRWREKGANEERMGPTERLERPAAFPRSWQEQREELARVVDPSSGRSMLPESDTVNNPRRGNEISGDLGETGMTGVRREGRVGDARS